MSKPRRFDFYPDDWLGGSGELSIEERGVYITACAAIYSRGGPITRDHLRRLCPCHRRIFDRVLNTLLDLGKLFETSDGKLGQNRCEIELKHARKRLETSQENGRKGGRFSSQNNGVAKPGGSSRAREGVASTITTNSSKRGKGDLGLGRVAPRTRADHEAVDRLVQSSVAALNSRKPTIRDPDAYGSAVDDNVRHAWLNRIANYVGLNFSGAARLEAQQAIEDARAAGSRKATPRRIQKLLDDLDQLDRAERQKGAA